VLHLLCLPARLVPVPQATDTRRWAGAHQRLWRIILVSSSVSLFRQLAARVIWSSGLRAMWSSDVRWFALERVLRIMVTALGMACARWRRGEKTGARPRAVGWCNSFTNVPRSW